MTAPIKRGTAHRLGLEPPRGPMLGVLTAANTVLLPEEYRQLPARFAKTVKENWSFIYSELDSETRGRQYQGRAWWSIGGTP